MRAIEIIDHDDNRLTEDFINEVDFFGSVDNYTRRDYLYVSHIYRDGKEVARVHNLYEDRYI